MKAMILAAGLGKRLRPATLYVPKPLFPVLGVPAIDWVLAGMQQAGIKQCAINVSHLAASIIRHVESGAQWGMEILWSVEPEVLGTGGGFSAVREFFEGEDAILLHNGDVFNDWNFGEIIQMHQDLGGAATMIMVDPPELAAAKMVEVDDQNMVVGIRGQPRAGDGRKFVFSGVSVHTQAIFDYLPKASDSCLIEQGIIPMLGDGKQVFGPAMQGQFCDIGTIERFLDVNWRLLPVAGPILAKRGLLVPNEVSPGVWIHEGADVSPDAVLQGPLLISHGSVIEAGAVIGPRAIIGGNATVAAGVCVQDCIVFDGAVAKGEVESLVLPQPASWVV
jgi:mannose-1-phosphate guanylyltransferase/phosphomannomutase